jgi:hypothetical protein
MGFFFLCFGDGGCGAETDDAFRQDQQNENDSQNSKKRIDHLIAHYLDRRNKAPTIQAHIGAQIHSTSTMLFSFSRFLRGPMPSSEKQKRGQRNRRREKDVLSAMSRGQILPRSLRREPLASLATCRVLLRGAALRDGNRKWLRTVYLIVINSFFYSACSSWSDAGQSIHVLSKQTLFNILVQHVDLDLLGSVHIYIIITAQYGCIYQPRYNIFDLFTVDTSQFLPRRFDQSPSFIRCRQMRFGRGKDAPASNHHHIAHQMRSDIGGSPALLFSLEPHDRVGYLRLDTTLRYSFHLKTKKPAPRTEGPMKGFRSVLAYGYTRPRFPRIAPCSVNQTTN